ncbi:RNA polymerase sigma factor SigJ [Virgisporangium aliadipatigenens]|uniref:RNA polymerase sigma factor SigJ n=1 Tax=Virgisporangium aliadipatigenens TaxID=741659 RepID=A0A8J4DSG0_9ACTN|nr:RNA polymerase sigma factor SigJ [Virgisporangium aliadipatigenens]GIJ48654.1 RNA polymerase sigma factor SigJ [Virgisporangium aliadipatigenens]
MTEDFEQHRDHLTAVAYRMLGTRGDAEDAVQEAYLRYATADRSTIRDVRAWLTTTTGRICIDVLRSARVRREAYVGQWLPEPVVERLPDPTDPARGGDPAIHVSRAAEVSLALLTVLERLTPEQRAAFVLHDVFAVPFDEVAEALGTTAAAARQLASRARRAVAEGPMRHSATRAEQERVLHAFLKAAQGGDVQRLMDLLAPDVVAIGDGGGVVPAGGKPVTGALQVARFMCGIFRQIAKRDAVAEVVLVNGSLGLSVRVEDQLVVMALGIEDGRVTAVLDQVNPAKLTAVPEPDPARNVFVS